MRIKGLHVIFRQVLREIILETFKFGNKHINLNDLKTEYNDRCKCSGFSILHIIIKIDILPQIG